MELPRTRLRAGAALATIALLAAGCSSGHSAAKAPPPSTEIAAAATRTASPRQAAVALADQMLNEVALPAGARRSNVKPPAVLKGPSSVPAIGNLVMAHRLFTIKERPHDVYEWLLAHAPSGFEHSGGGFTTTRGVQSWQVEVEPRARPVNTSYATLEQAVTGPKVGPSVIRVDAVVGWTAPRPANSYAPARDRVVTVSAARANQPGAPGGRSQTTSDPKLVKPIVRTFNRLRVEPPNDVHSCPAMDSSTLSYRVAFKTALHAVPDVVATIGACGGVAVTVRGQPAPSLDFTNEDAFANAAVKVLGLDEPHFH